MNYVIGFLIVFLLNTIVSDVLKKEFSLKEEFLPICLLPIGYREVGCLESPNHKIRKSLEETVIYVE